LVRTASCFLPRRLKTPCRARCNEAAEADGNPNIKQDAETAEAEFEEVVIVMHAPTWNPDRTKADCFLHALVPQTDRFSFQTFTDSKAVRKKYKAERKRDPLARVFHGTLAEHWDELVRLSAAGAGVYVAVNETNLHGREATDIVRVRYHFVDMDGAPLGNLARLGLRPHIIIQSSPGKFHVYWRVQDALLDHFKATQKRLLALVDSDPNVCDLPRVMRLPGFPHQKEPDQPFMFEIAAQQSFEAYSAADFQNALAAAEQAHSRANPGSNQPRSLTADLADGLPNPAPDMRQSYPNGQRTKQLTHRIGWCLGPWNMSEDETMTAVLAWNEHNDPPLDEQKVSDTVASIARSDAKKRQSKEQPAALAAAADGAPQGSVYPAFSGTTADNAEIERLSRLPPLEYERQRKDAAKKLGCRESVLDKLIEARASTEAPGQGTALDLRDPDPWPEPVDGSELIKAIASSIGRYVVLPRQSIVAIALWIVHAHAFKAFSISPRLGITSPEKRCGKTRLLQVMGAMVPKPVLAANITAAAMFRTIEAERPTLLIDEADTFLSENQELRGVINSGHDRHGAVVRTVGDDHEPRLFSTWCPTVVAAIGKLPGTIEDRAVHIVIRRRRRDETVDRFRSDRCDDLLLLKRKIWRWVGDHMNELCVADPATPSELNDRASDNWRPLLAVADLAGENWPEWGRAAALALSGDGAVDQDSMRTTLLGDIRTYFIGKGSDRVSSDDLVYHLVALDDRPWSEMNRGKAMTKATLARLLKPFEIFPDTVRLDATRTAKGYHLSAFEDAFGRYLSSQNVTT
jgi:putative DNA primase/helicase